MNKYSELSDFEINKLVAIYLGVRPRKTISFIGQEKDIYPDYCSNPSDAWPIICESIISIVPHYKFTDESEEYIAHSNEWVADNVMSDGKSFRYKDINPLRAAMIVYLMMNGGENA